MARLAANRINLQVSVASYVGNGSDDRQLSLVSFEPHLFLTKGGANNALFRTRHFHGDAALALAQLTAATTDRIQGLCYGGAVLGTNAEVNANGTTYYTLMIRGVAAQDYFRTFRYYGNAADDRTLNTIGLNNTPDVVLIKGDTVQRCVFRIAPMVGDTTGRLSGSADANNEIQSLLAGGVQLGTAAAVNSNAVEYFGIAMKKLPGVFDCGTYIGTGAIQTIMTDFGLDWIIIKNGSGTNQAIFKTSAMGATQSYRLNTTNVATTDITALGTNGGFTLGTTSEVNALGSTYWWFGGKAGNFNAPAIRQAAINRLPI